MNRSSNSGSRRLLSLPEPALDLLIALVLNLIFIGLAALLLWPLGKTTLSLRLAKGYVVFWIVTAITAIGLYQMQRLFRIDIDERVNAYVLSNLAHGLFLLLGWSAFSAISVHSSVAGMTIWPLMILWTIGVMSSVVALVVVTTIHRGVVYRLVNVIATVVSFLVFAIWPAAAHAIFGWFFHLF